MRPLQVLIVFLILGGCSSNHSEQEPAQLIPAPPEASQRDISVTLSPAGRSASPKTETGLPPHGNSLMDCVTDPCTINCSKSVAKRSKQKRCAHFKEPVVAKPAVAANVVSKERSKSPDIDQNRPVSVVNYDGAVLHLFDAYAVLKGVSTDFSDDTPILRVPLWWPSQFRQHKS